MSQKTLIFIKRYLQRAPIALALWRSIEAKYVATVPLKSPILDIGCGFGEFAEVFFDKPVDFGLDINYQEIIMAIKTGKYKNYTLADATHMPYPDNFFATVLSISTFEHIKNPQHVLAESFRVLKPGGTLVVTVVLDNLNDYIFYGPLLTKLGFPKAGKKYTQMYNKVFKHVTLRSRERWENDIKKYGFRIITSREIISPCQTRLFDKLLIFAWPSQLVKFLIGRRVSIRPQFLDDFIAKKLSTIIENETDTRGNTLFLVAKKRYK